MHTCMQVRMYVRMCVCVYVCMCVCMCVCVCGTVRVATNLTLIFKQSSTVEFLRQSLWYLFPEFVPALPPVLPAMPLCR